MLWKCYWHEKPFDWPHTHPMSCHSRALRRELGDINCRTWSIEIIARQNIPPWPERSDPRTMLEICIVGKVVAVWQKYSTHRFLEWSNAHQSHLASGNREWEGWRGGGNLNGNGISEKDIATRDIQLNEIFLCCYCLHVGWLTCPALPIQNTIRIDLVIHNFSRPRGRLHKRNSLYWSPVLVDRFPVCLPACMHAVYEGTTFAFR